MIHVSVGNTFDYKLLDGLSELSNPAMKVTELFGSIKGISPTCRSEDRIPYRSFPDLEEYVKRAASLGMDLTWTLNANCLGKIEDFERQWNDSLVPTLGRLWEYGVHRFIIAHPLMMKLVRAFFPEAYLEVSTVAEVDSVDKILFWRDLGANAICGKHSLNREFTILEPFIKECKSLGMAYRFIVNELCIKECPYRTSCYLASSHNSERKVFGGWPFSDCSDLRKKNPYLWVSAPFILPQWLPFYVEKFGPDLSIKIVGRTSSTENVLRVTNWYFDGYYGGNLLDIWPGVEHLVGREPVKEIISCARLDEKGFFQYFLNRGRPCSVLECGKYCTHCLDAYERAREKKAG